MISDELENLMISLSFLEKRGACSSAISEFKKSGRKRISLLEVLNWVREHEKKEWETWLISQPEYCKALIRYGADVNAGGGIALRIASRKLDLERIKFLFKHGANMRIGNDFPLWQAALHGDLEMAKFLIHEAGARANEYIANSAGWHGQKEVKEFLESHIEKTSN